MLFFLSEPLNITFNCQQNNKTKNQLQLDCVLHVEKCFSINSRSNKTRRKGITDPFNLVEQCLLGCEICKQKVPVLARQKRLWWTTTWPVKAVSAFATATCIGCGACVACCRNASASLFVAAKLPHLAPLPQG